MASEMSKFSILIFDGKMDFTVWKMTIEDVLVQQGIDEALEEKQPAEMKDDVWKTMQKKASSTIRLALAPEIKYSVLKEKTPKDIWDKLTNIYASKSLTHRLFLKMELYSLKLEEGSNLHDHINSFNQLVCQLANVDDAIKDEEQALLTLLSLPKSYKPFVQTMLIRRTTLTFEDVLKTNFNYFDVEFRKAAKKLLRDLTAAALRTSNFYATSTRQEGDGNATAYAIA
ncbi:hypothetical protein Tco_1157688, partial [Tanacetum coccineum]